jgi:hypothetical protein
MVVVGTVEISVERDGKSYSIGLIGPGGLFGEMAWIDRAPRDMIQSNPDALVRIVLTLIHRLRDRGMFVLFAVQIDSRGARVQTTQVAPTILRAHLCGRAVAWPVDDQRGILSAAPFGRLAAASASNCCDRAAEKVVEDARGRQRAGHQGIVDGTDRSDRR